MLIGRGPHRAARDRRRVQHRPRPPARVHPDQGQRALAAGWPEAYGRMLVEELKPFIDARYRTDAARERTGLGGASLGGLVTMFLGLRHADVFGRLAVMSPSVWWDKRAILRYVAKASPKPTTRIWLDMGTAESKHGIADARRLRAALVKAGWREDVDLAYSESQGATHSEAAWAHRVGDVLQFLYPGDFGEFQSLACIWGQAPLRDPSRGLAPSRPPMLRLASCLALTCLLVTVPVAAVAQVADADPVHAIDGPPAPVPPATITRDASGQATVRAIKLLAPLDRRRHARRGRLHAEPAVRRSGAGRAAHRRACDRAHRRVADVRRPQRLRRRQGLRLDAARALGGQRVPPRQRAAAPERSRRRWIRHLLRPAQRLHVLRQPARRVLRLLGHRRRARPTATGIRCGTCARDASTAAGRWR